MIPSVTVVPWQAQRFRTVGVDSYAAMSLAFAVLVASVSLACCLDVNFGGDAVDLASGGTEDRSRKFFRRESSGGGDGEHDFLIATTASTTTAPLAAFSKNSTV